MDYKYILFGILIHLYYQFEKCNTEKITYIGMEHPLVTYFDTTHFNNITLLSRRLSRRDPRHYVQLYLNILKPLSNDVRVDFYFYQFLTNRYRPSFVEMHFKFCDMVESDTFFGTPVKIALGNRSCPLPPGEYDLKNMYIHYIPKAFPFVKGRIYCNASIDRSSKLIASGQLDMEVKVGNKNE